jgi:two-component system, OmpR family, sensor histidine kinase BaeS
MQASRRYSIRVKLALFLCALSLSLIALILLASKVSFDNGFEQYINTAHQERMQQLADRLSQLATDRQAWQRLVRDEGYWLDQLAPFMRGPGPRFAGSMPPPPQRWGPPPDAPDRGPHVFMPPPGPPPSGQPVPAPAGMRRLRVHGGAIWLLDAGKQQIHGFALASPDQMQMLPVTHDGDTIAYVAWQPIRMHDNSMDAYFAQRQHRLFLGIAAVAVVISVALAWVLSRVLVQPVRRLSAAMHALMQRQYEVRVPVDSSDELGDLADDFNRMAKTLGEYDSSQRQWLADISHELRTPLAVLRGELEAIADKIIPLDENSIQSLQEEVAQLGLLVDDLHQLAVTGLGALQYRFDRIDLGVSLQLLQERMELTMSKARLQFNIELPEGPVLIKGDRQRIDQMLLNLAQNSIRYTEAGGRVHVRLFADDAVHLRWDDSTPGVADADIAHLFTRFHRVENSRQRALGGSGLGLAIVSNIVNAHGGYVAAAASPLGGLHIDISLPLATAL